MGGREGIYCLLREREREIESRWERTERGRVVEN